MKNLAKEDQSLVEKIVAWLRSMMNKFTDWLHKPSAGLTTDQRAKMFNNFGKNRKTTRRCKR
ncbi:MAG: hypothetical protein IJ728_13335 [Selenomonadaceae bacterium]|nr:hypothetical protein [Selenomonadaceae bacterium]